VWVLKRELLWIPVVGWASASCMPSPSTASQATRPLRQVIEHGQAALAEGDWIIIFPEGTAPCLQVRDASATARAARCSRPKRDRLIVPVAHNAGAYWPRRGLLKKPGTVRSSSGHRLPLLAGMPAEINQEHRTGSRPP